MEEGSLFSTCSPAFIGCRFFDDGHSDFPPLGFPHSSVGKESACNAGDLSSGQEDPLEKEMAIHSTIFAWKIPWTEEPGGRQSMGSQDSDMT